MAPCRHLSERNSCRLLILFLRLLRRSSGRRGARLEPMPNSARSWLQDRSHEKRLRLQSSLQLRGGVRLENDWAGRDQRTPKNSARLLRFIRGGWVAIRTWPYWRPHGSSRVPIARSHSGEAPARGWGVVDPQEKDRWSAEFQQLESRSIWGSVRWLSPRPWAHGPGSVIGWLAAEEGGLHD